MAQSLDNTLEHLYEVIVDRREQGDDSSSYVARLSSRGRKKICEKLGEECFEVVVDAVDNKKKRVIEESADMLFHLMVLWADMGIKPSAVAKEIKRRDGVSGIDEKAARKKS